MKLHANIVIVGGGPVGLTLALQLAKYNLSSVIIAAGLADNPAAADPRLLALSIAAQATLDGIGAWPQAVTAIDCVRISHHGLGVSQIMAADLGLKHLGYTVSYNDLCAKLLDKVKLNPLIKLIAGQVTAVNDGSVYVSVNYTAGRQQILTADLVLMADGGELLTTKVKNYDYAKVALLGRIKTLQQPFNIAYERLTRNGPLVLLPDKNNFMCLWALNTKLGNQYLQSPLDLMTALNHELGERLGGAQLDGDLSMFPLRLRYTSNRVLQRVILVGNSAQALHPISAQGLNLGLRDVSTLSALLARIGTGDLDGLKQFNQLRKADAATVVKFTHALAQITGHSGNLISHLRGIGIIALSNFPFLQNELARTLIYGV